MTHPNFRWTLQDELLYLETLGRTHVQTATMSPRQLLQNYLETLPKRVAPAEIVDGRDRLAAKCRQLIARIDAATAEAEAAGGAP